MLTSLQEVPHIEAIAFLKLQEAERELNRLWEPPQRLTISEWSERNRFLPRGTTARPGKFIPEPFQVEPMNAILDPEIHRIVWMKSTQVGYNESVLNNIIGYFIDIAPRPILLVVPSEDDAKGYSKKRVQPMIDNCEPLRRKIRKATARRPGNTLQLKEFDGGFFKLTGANSGKGLRSDAIPLLLLDEVDAYPDDVDGEGDPVDIALRRTDTYDDAKVVLGSTPAKPKGLSRIEEEFEASDQRRYHVPCPFCGFMQPFWWRDPVTQEYRLAMERDEHGRLIPSTAKYRCGQCSALIEEKWKLRMLSEGKWIPAFPERKHVRGYHINALYSPWRSLWQELAAEWVKAQDNPEKLKTFFNLRLGETWDQGGHSFNANVLESRLEKYEHEVPAGVAVLVAAADIQATRIECQIVGFGAGEEAWLIDHEQFYGNPSSSAEVWAELDDYLLKPWKHEFGFEMKPAIALVDSGDASGDVYEFVKPRQHAGRRVYAVKGVDHLSRPGLVKESTAKKAAVRLWLAGTHAIKDRIFARLAITKPEKPGRKPGLMHLPTSVTTEYLDQLTGEKKITERDKRTRAKRHVWVKTHHNNEALDMWVYSHAALAVLQLVDKARYGDLDKLAAEIQKTKQLQVPQRSGWRVRPLGAPG